MKDGIIYNKADLIIDTQMTGGGGDKRDYASPFMYTSHPNRHGDNSYIHSNKKYHHTDKVLNNDIFDRFFDSVHVNNDEHKNEHKNEHKKNKSKKNKLKMKKKQTSTKKKISIKS